MGKIQKLNWSALEMKLITEAVERIRTGNKIYYEVMKLKRGPLRYRTYESIRCCINRVRTTNDGL